MNSSPLPKWTIFVFVCKTSRLPKEVLNYPRHNCIILNQVWTILSLCQITWSLPTTPRIPQNNPKITLTYLHNFVVQTGQQFHMAVQRTDGVGGGVKIDFVWSPHQAELSRYIYLQTFHLVTSYISQKSTQQLKEYIVVDIPSFCSPN